MLNTNYINVDINSLTILDDNDEPIYIIQIVKEEAKPKQPILKLPKIMETTHVYLTSNETTTSSGLVLFVKEVCELGDDLDTKPQEENKRKTQQVTLLSLSRLNL
jgi:hypothetical protein